MSFTSQDSSSSNETFGKDASFKLPQLIGSMSISPSGRDVVLGSKEGLHIIDLDTPYSPPRFLPHRTPWEVADVQWSPFAARDYWVVSTSNQKALVWNLSAYGWRNSIEHVLHGHTRAITDINFSAHHPDRLATCAVDSFVHCWDLRTPARPVTSFSDWFAAATQVKWSRQDEHVVASSHDKFLHIWDDRMGAYPSRTIEAHDTKIYGIDWNRFEPSKIVTCSLDKTIKFWDTNKAEDIPDRVIETSFPVWRARHTPFGWGLMVMPQRGNGDLHIYDRRAMHGEAESGHVQPVHVFPGHKGQVKEFLWRAFGTVKDGIDHRDFQLVSWGTDRDLKLHAVSRDIFEDVGYERGVSKPQRMHFTRRGARYRTFRDEPNEHDAALSATSRVDSFPASNQFLRVRGRPSTNMGMNRAPVAQFKGWLQAGKAGRRTDMHGKGASRPDTDPMSWMKNVKIASWDTDVLADEITLVGEMFKNINFEDINLSQRKATMSFQSPWGDAPNTSVYTRLDLRFPKGYPKTAPAVVHVQRTNSISSDTQKSLSADIHKIADAYKLRGRGCLEAVVRFSLREESLEQIIAWIMRDSLTESKLIESADFLQDGSDESDDDQIGTQLNLAQSNANVNVPLAKGCAALWSETGKLVCFFTQRDKEPASLLSTLGTGHMDDSENNKIFGGFGRFEVDTPSRKAKEALASAEQDSASVTSDQSSVFSSSTSSSESSGDFGARNKRAPFQRPALESWGRGKSADGSQKSTILESTRAGDTAQKTIVSIHDFGDLLLGNRAAAQEYYVSGDTTSACQHNKYVALKYLPSAVSTIWQLIDTVVRASNQDEMKSQLQGDPSLSLLATMVEKLSAGRPSVELFTFYDHSAPLLPGTVLSQLQLLPGLVELCDKQANVQCLAVLSAIYLQSQKDVFDMLRKLAPSLRRVSTSNHTLADDHSSLARARYTPGNAELLTQHHRNSLHHSSPDKEVLGYDVSNYRDANSLPSALSLPGNHLSSTQPSSRAPSVIAYDPSGFVSAMHSTNGSLAGSPEDHRLSRRSEPFVALPAAAASLHALARSRPPSPPSQLVRQNSGRNNRSVKPVKPSPDESFLRESKNRGKPLSSMNNASLHINDSNRTRLNHSHRPSILKTSGQATPVGKPRKKRLKTRIHTPTAPSTNRDLLSEQYVHTYSKCLNYIQQYLPQLEAWQLWVQRAELVRICAETSRVIDTLNQDMSWSSTRPRNGAVLELRKCCPSCGNVMQPIEKNGLAIGWHCTTHDCNAEARKPSKKQRCSICETVMTGLCIPCLQCSHLTCFACAQEWFGQLQADTLKRDSSMSYSSSAQLKASKKMHIGCPTGCGCTCEALTSIIVPDPESVTSERDGETTTLPTTPRSEGYQESVTHMSDITERRSNRGQSVSNVKSAPDSAINALLALNLQSRHRSTSSTATAVRPSQSDLTAARGMRARDNSISVVDELLPWVNDQHASLARGSGGGLSRGLSNKASDSTIRKTSMAEQT